MKLIVFDRDNIQFNFFYDNFFFIKSSETLAKKIPSKSEQRILFAPILMNICFAFASDDSKKIERRKILSKKKNEFFYFFNCLC